MDFNQSDSALNITETSKWIIPRLNDGTHITVRIVFISLGLPLNVVIILLVLNCRRLWNPRNLSWVGVMVVAVMTQSLGVLELVAYTYPSAGAYYILLLFLGSPYMLFSISYASISIERYLAITYYMWHKRNITNKVVITVFWATMLTICMASCLLNSYESHLFTDGTSVNRKRKLLIFGVIVNGFSLVAIVLQIKIFIRIKTLYDKFPRLKDKTAYRIRYKASSIARETETIGGIKPCTAYFKSPVSYLSNNGHNEVCNYSQKSTNRTEVEAAFYFFLASLPILIFNITCGTALIANWICAQNKNNGDCFGLWATLPYFRTILWVVTAINPTLYVGISTEFRSAIRSRFFRT